MAEVSFEKAQLAARLKTARSRAGVSTAEAATAAGMKPKAFYHWESGQATPDIFKLKALARLYGVSLDEIVNGEADWPLPGVSVPKIRRLDAADRVRLETAVLLAAATLNLDVTNPLGKRDTG